MQNLERPSLIMKEIPGRLLATDGESSSDFDPATDAESTADAESKFDSEGTFASEIFQDNAGLLDYLNALLKPHPQLDFDSGEVRFVYNDTHKDSEFVSIHSSVVDNIVRFGTDQAKNEAQELRNENHALKLKVARLLAQLNETECSMEAIQSENAGLKASLSNLQAQLTISRMITKNHREIVKMKSRHASLHLPEAKEPVAEPKSEIETVDWAPVMPETIMPAAEESVEPEMEPIEPVEPEVCEAAVEAMPEEEPAVQTGLPAWSSSETVADQVPAPLQVAAEQPATRGAAGLLPAQNEVAVPIYAVPAVVAEKRGAGEPVVREPVYAGGDAAATIAAAAAVPEKTVRQVAEESPQPAKPRVGLTQPVQSSRPTSKVIKSHEVKKQPAEQKAEPTFKEISPSEKPKAETEKPKPVLAQFIPEPEQVEPEPEQELAADKEMLQPGVAETGIEPAPIPKVLVKKQMQNYQQSQDEADAVEPKTPRIPHDIIRL